MTFVPGEGPLPCRGMVIGEAPGRTEVEHGRPFIGPSGKLLDQALIALGIERKEIYVTNVVKTLPLDGSGKIRKPTISEMEHGKGRLMLEIKEADPVCILALGRTAQDFLMGHEVAHVAAWHPAYVLRRHGGLSVEWLEQIRPWAEAVR